jgi:hypothetical protein
VELHRELRAATAALHDAGAITSAIEGDASSIPPSPLSVNASLPHSLVLWFVRPPPAPNPTAYAEYVRTARALLPTSRDPSDTALRLLPNPFRWTLPPPATGSQPLEPEPADPVSRAPNLSGYRALWWAAPRYPTPFDAIENVHIALLRRAYWPFVLSPQY